MCSKNGPRIVDENVHLYRHIDPAWLQEDGEPSSQAFWPFREKDEGCLSVDLAARTTPQNSYALFTGAPPAGYGRTSAGIWALTVAEVHAEALEAWEDPSPGGSDRPVNHAHAVVEFGALSKSQMQKMARKLKYHALQRGKVF